MPTNDLLLNQATRHQHFLERFKGGEAKKVQKFLRAIDRDIRKTLSNEGATIQNQARLRKLLTLVNQAIRTNAEELGNELIASMSDLGVSEADFERRGLKKVANTGVSILPAASDNVLAAVFNRPFEGKLMKDHLRNYTQRQISRIDDAIRTGFFEGETVSQITRRIRGTRANKFKDGILEISRRDAVALTRTALQHTSSEARNAVWKANKDIIEGVEWVSTLDSRTTNVCKQLDGQVFPVDKGPRPPAHFNCRSTTTPVIKDLADFQRETSTRASSGSSGGKQVPAKETYSSWLTKQSVEFQNEALGPKRAALFRKGDLKLDQFVDDNGRDITLAELRGLYPLAFEKAGI